MECSSGRSETSAARAHSVAYNLPEEEHNRVNMSWNNDRKKKDASEIPWITHVTNELQGNIETGSANFFFFPEC